MKKRTNSQDIEHFQFPRKCVDSLHFNGIYIALNNLKLKQGTIVIFLRNLNVVNGLMNRTWFIFRNTYNNYLDF